MDSHFSEVVTRFAPSPTGYLHLGGLRTALFAYLMARRHGGRFLLRIEDTDRARWVQGAEEDILESLRWAGLAWDGAVQRQSERTSLYQAAAHRLVQEGHAYLCFCSAERLESLKVQRQGMKRSYDGHCRGLSPEEAAAKKERGEPYVIRAQLPQQGDAVVEDALRGNITVPYEQLEDMILLKSDGTPTYHLAHVVDDHAMEVSHVLRGSEWISTFPLHDFLWKALGYPAPTYYHLPLILSHEGGKLAKRHGSFSVQDYRRGGYVAEGLINFLALLGWAYDDRRTFFTLEELEKLFCESKIAKSAATYSEQHLKHFNQYHIGKLPEAAFCSQVRDILQQTYPSEPWDDPAFEDRLQQAALLYQSRLVTLTQITEHLAFFFEEVSYSAGLWQSSHGDKQRLLTALNCAAEVVEALEKWDQDELQQRLRQLCKSRGWKLGEVLMPLRFALTAQPSSPHIMQLTFLLGRHRTLGRIKSSVDYLQSNALQVSEAPSQET